MGALRHIRTLGAVALLLLAGLVSACASSGTVKPRPFPTPAGSATSPPTSQAQPPAPTPVPVAPGNQTVVETALSFRGTPYRNGGSDPAGFDCSGLTQWVFAAHGIALPRDVQDQFKIGRKVKLDDLEPGDLIFFHTIARGPSHVGIVIDGDQFVHAPSSNGVVRVERISSSYWSRRVVGVRRVRPEPAAVRRRPSDEGSTAVAAAAAHPGARDSATGD